MSKKKQRKLAAETAPAPQQKQKATASPTGLNNMSNWLIVLLLVLPLLYSWSTMDALLSIRYITLSIFLLLFVLYFFLYKKTVASLSLPGLNRVVFAAGLVYAVWMVVCLSGALNYHEGYYEVGRYLLGLLYLFMVMVTVMREEEKLMKVFTAMVVVAIIHSLVGIMQHYETGFTNIPGSNSKPYGLMANRNIYGSALMLMLPFVLYALHRGHTLLKTLAAIALGLQVFALLLSQTRSAWLAAAMIIIVSLTLVLIFSKTNRRKWLIGTGAMAIVSAGIIFLVLAGDSEGELKQSVTERTKSFTRGGVTSDENRENVQERFRIWRKTIALIKDKPIIGAGPGNWKLTIPEYGTEGLVWSGGLYAPDRVHNVYLQVAAKTGIPGALIYFGMWLLIVLIAFKIILHPKTEEQRIMIILMLAGLAGLASDAMFSFPTERFEHTIFFYLMAGIILGVYANNTVTEKKLSLKQPLIAGLALLCLINLVFGFYKFNFESHWQKAKEFENAGQYAEMVKELDKGKNPFITLTPDVGAPIELKTAIALKELKQYDRAMREIDKAWQYHPNSAAVWNTLGTIHTEVRQFDKAVVAYERAKKIAPHYDVVLKNLGVNYYNLKRYKDCYLTLSELDVSSDPMLQQVKDYCKQMAGDSLLVK
ncbi:MAG TPA: O-antigen ligase family protein [Chitinophagaceae bacterium]